LTPGTKLRAPAKTHPKLKLQALKWLGIWPAEKKGGGASYPGVLDSPGCEAFKTEHNPDCTKMPRVPADSDTWFWGRQAQHVYAWKSCQKSCKKSGAIRATSAVTDILLSLSWSCQASAFEVFPAVALMRVIFYCRWLLDPVPMTCNSSVLL